MRRGFIFKESLCVGCGACRAACMLENSWDIQPRTIYIYNSAGSGTIPLINLSLACNHCEKPVCLEGCPSGAYSADSATGAVLINEAKCIGCRYCQWNCPYDAPKFNDEKRIIGKCNLCYSGLNEGRLPACANGCPTGALKFGQLNNNYNSTEFTWFPDKKLSPGIQFAGTNNKNPLIVIPEEKNLNDEKYCKSDEKILSTEWSLIAFSFLAVLSVSEILTSLIKGSFPDAVFSGSLLILTAVASLFHLGRKLRAWRAVSNLRKSPLSREIAFFALFSIISIAAVLLEYPVLLVIASISGLLFLLSVDSVYLFADSRKKVMLHGGQTFLTALLVVSFTTGNILPFLFIAMLKAVSAAFNLFLNTRTGLFFVLRFFRLAILFISSALLISGINAGNIIALVFFLAGEFFERIIFYIDFNPININDLIVKHQKSA